MTDGARLSESNMRAWYLARVAAASGTLGERDALAWGIVPEGLAPPGSGRIVPFPGPADAGALDEMLAAFGEAGLPPWCTFGIAARSAPARLAFKQAGFALQFAALSMERQRDEAPEDAAPEGFGIVTGSDATFAAGAEHPSYGSLSEAAARTTLAAVLRLAQAPDACLTVLAALADDGVVAGWVTLYRHAGCTGIYDLGVLEAYRRFGVGGTLLRAGLDQASGYGPIVLQNDASLEPFYRRYGFRRVGTIEHWVRPPEGSVDTSPDLRVEDLAVAIGTHDLAAVRRMIAADPQLLGARLAATGATPLHLAAYYGLDAPIGEMLARSADPEARDRAFGGTPLDWAMHALDRAGPVFKSGQAAAARKLIAAGTSSGEGTAGLGARLAAADE